MNKRVLILSAVFISTSMLVFMLGIHLIATQVSTSAQLIITTCGEILMNIQKNTYINQKGVTSLLILFIAMIGISLAIIQMVKFLLSYNQLTAKHRGADSLPSKLNWIVNKHNLQHIVFVITPESRLVAHTTGLIQPRVIISNSLISWVSRSQLEAIILHESYHVRNKHVLWLLFSRIISSLLFFVPLIKYLAQQLKIEFELAADSFVVQKQETSDHLRSSLTLNLQYANETMVDFSTSPIELRVESLLTKNVAWERIKSIKLGLSLVSISLMIGLSLALPSKATALPTVETNSVCLFEEGCRTMDCISHQNTEKYYFTSFIPTTFQVPTTD